MNRFNAGNATEVESNLIYALAPFALDLIGTRKISHDRPLLLSYALTDSPVRYAEWMFFILTNATPLYQWTMGEILSWTMLLHIQGPFGSVRMYKELVERVKALAGALKVVCVYLLTPITGRGPMVEQVRIH